VPLSAAELARIYPACRKPAQWVGPLETAMARFGIDRPGRIAAFLAQVGHESAECNRVTENLNYSAKGLMETWPGRFPTLAKAQEYARQPEKIANYVYAGRMGNGDGPSGDGWRFRGRGLIQVTGRSNYRAAAQVLGLPLEAQPELLAEAGHAAMSAAQFWSQHGCNELADAADDAAFVAITERVNGGRTGLAERRKIWARAKAVLGVV
jgi:putative chitinase